MKGFTLIELMLVVVIIGILVAVAYPSYKESIRNTKRAEAQSEMLEVAKNLQRYKVANFNYMKIDNSNAEVPIVLSDVGHNGILPKAGAAMYDLVLSNVDLSRWTLTATPKAGTLMAGNGVICMNSQGQKFWQRGVATCSLSPTSSWDK